MKKIKNKKSCYWATFQSFIDQSWQLSLQWQEQHICLLFSYFQVADILSGFNFCWKLIDSVIFSPVNYFFLSFFLSIFFLLTKLEIPLEN